MPTESERIAELRELEEAQAENARLRDELKKANVVLEMAKAVFIGMTHTHEEIDECYRDLAGEEGGKE